MFRVATAMLALLLFSDVSAPLFAQDGGANGGSGKAPAAPRQGNLNKHGRSSRSQSSGAPANSRTEIIGSDSDTQRGTMDRPLLPIAVIGNSLGIRSGTPIHIRLTKTVDSGHARNGDLLDATLAEPLAKLPVGAPVKVTVVQASPAGALLSFGELSLQVISIGGKPVLSDTISAQGKEGKKDQADSAPGKGTEAVFSNEDVITLPAA